MIKINILKYSLIGLLAIISCRPNGTNQASLQLGDEKKCNVQDKSTCLAFSTCFWEGTICEDRVIASQCSDLDGYPAQCKAFSSQQCVVDAARKCTKGSTAPLPSTLLVKPATMPQNIYDAIKNHGGTNSYIADKNIIIPLVNNALTGPKANRDAAIRTAIGSQANLAGLDGVVINLLSVVPPPIDCGAPGSGEWDFGTRTVGPLADQSAPFIQGTPPGTCSVSAHESTTIQNDILNDATGTPGQKIAIFTMGAPGCGKSSSLQAVMSSLGFTKEQFVIIDPDEARSRVQAFKNATNILSSLCLGKKRSYEGAVPWCLKQGQSIRNFLMDKVFTEEKSYIFDSSCSDATYCKNRMQQARTAGFRVYLVAVYTEEETCKDRALLRALKTGRYAKPDYISDTWKNIKTAQEFKNLASVANKSFIFDNNGATTVKIYESNVLTCSTKSQPACAYFKP